MTADQNRFEARRDIHGAFATAPGASAHYEEHHHYHATVSDRSFSGPIFFNLPSLPPRYQARAEDLTAIRDKLLTGSTPVGIASTAQPFGLHGMGGIGKTVLAIAVVRDPTLREAYPDGMAWLTFGRGVSVLTKAAELAFALTRSEASFTSVDEAGGRLSLLTQDRRLLVVLDDVWEPGAVDPFTRLGPGCRLVLTTRDNGVLDRAGADCHELALLSQPAAREFLATAAGVPIGELTGEADDLVKECGRLPMALAAVGALIRSNVYTWSDALAALKEAALEEFEDQHDRTLTAVLKLSVDALPDDARAAFFDCAAFHEDVAIPEATLLRLWSDRTPERAAKRLAQQLVERCLINRDDQAAADGRPRYRIHDLYMDYLHSAAAPLPARHQHVIERYGAVCPNGWSDGPDDGYFIQHLPWHLREAGEVKTLRSLLFDASWLRRKLSIAGVLALISDYRLIECDPEIIQLGAALELSIHALRRYPEELKTQLCGRLIPEDGSSIADLLYTLHEDHGDLFDPARHGYLTQPGALRRTIPTGDAVSALAVLPSGKRAFSLSWHGRLHLWDLDTGAELRCFDGTYFPDTGVTPLLDGKRVLSAKEYGALCLWDLETGAELRYFDQRDRVCSVALLPDGRRVLCGSDHGTLHLWDLDTGAELRRFDGHDGRVGALALLPGGRHAVSGSNDDTLRLWDLDTGDALRRFGGHKADVVALALLPDGRRALSGSVDSTLRLWDLDTGDELYRFDGHVDRVTAVVLLPDGRRFLSGSEDKTLRLWDLDTGDELSRFDGHVDGVTAVALLPDGRRVLAGAWDGVLRLWNLDSNAEVRPFDGHDDGVITVALLPDRKHALSGSSDRTLRLWDLNTGAELRRFTGHRGTVRTVALLPDGKRALSSSSDRTLRLWDLDTGDELRRFDGHTERVTAFALLPDSRRALSGSDDETLRLWDLDTGAELRRFEGHGGPVRALALLPDGRRTVSGSSDNTLRLWDLNTGDELRRFDGHKSDVQALALLTDGRRALSGSYDMTLRLWDLDTGDELRRFDGHDGWVCAIALLSDGRRALSGSYDKTLRLWDLDTGDELRRFDGHVDRITSVVPLPGDQRALTCSADNTLRLWDLTTGAVLASFTPDGVVAAIALSPDGDRVVIGDATGRVIPLDIQT
jgi:WD40 repeat protein